MALSTLMNNAAYSKVTAITPSDATTYSPALDALIIGGAGNVAIVDINGTTVTINAPVVGQILPIGATKVLATGTTATVIRGLNY